MHRSLLSNRRLWPYSYSRAQPDSGGSSSPRSLHPAPRPGAISETDTRHGRRLLSKRPPPVTNGQRARAQPSAVLQSRRQANARTGILAGLTVRTVRLVTVAKAGFTGPCLIRSLRMSIKTYEYDGHEFTLTLHAKGELIVIRYPANPNARGRVMVMDRRGLMMLAII